MNPLLLSLAIPVASAILFAFVPSFRVSARLNVVASLATLLASLCLICERPPANPYFLIDDFNIYLIVLTTFVAFTTSLFSVRYVTKEMDIGRLTPRLVRFYHAMYQTFVTAMLVALSTNNLGVLWVAVECATLSTVLMVSLYRTPQAVEAGWKYFIICSAGIAMALFGTTLLYLAAQPVLGAGLPAMTWSSLIDKAAAFNPMLLNLAFVFLLVGYGTKVGLVPFHTWLPDAHAEGPTPVSAVLSGLLLNVALYAVLRFKMLMAGNPGALSPSLLMVVMGLGTLLFASIMLYRRRDIKRLFAYSSIEHMGIITFAFGMGGPLANFAGLLHMMMHSLTKSAIFFAVGHASQIKGTQKISDIRGLTESHPLLGWTLAFGVVAIAGMPPFGIFMSEFLVVSSTFARHPWLAAPLVLGLLVSFGALILRLQGLCFGPGSNADIKASKRAMVPLILHLVLVMIAGVYLPPALVAWLENVARLLG